VVDDLQRAAAQNADAVVRRFFDSAGRLKNLPAKQSRQLAVFDLIAQRFVPGVRYTETEVNHELMQVFDDYVSLRRGLVDFGLLDRADGRYWRSGGTVAVDDPAASTGRPNPSERPTVPATAPSARGAARREAILAAAAQLFADRGYAAVGMDDIGAAAGVTGPAIYRHFGAKASVLTAVFDRVIDAVAYDRVEVPAAPDSPEQDAARLRELVVKYADAVCGRRRLMAVFVREVHHLPAEDRALLDERQRVLVRRWRTLLGHAHPDWDVERVRTAVHGAFGMLNVVGTFDSPLPDVELARQMSELAINALQLNLPAQAE
jgi:AcrR family transcriptional regulator